MMGRQARASVRVMRLWKPHDPGRSCLPLTIRHHVANETDSQNDGALPRTLASPDHTNLDISRSAPRSLLTCDDGRESPHHLVIALLEGKRVQRHRSPTVSGSF